jgi:hypothetical protein
MQTVFPELPAMPLACQPQPPTPLSPRAPHKGWPRLSNDAKYSSSAGFAGFAKETAITTPTN